MIQQWCGVNSLQAKYYKTIIITERLFAPDIEVKCLNKTRIVIHLKICVRIVYQNEQKCTRLLGDYCTANNECFISEV